MIWVLVFLKVVLLDVNNISFHLKFPEFLDEYLQIMMQKNCPPIFPQIMNQKKQIEYISTIIKCEQEKSDKPLIEYLAKGMTKYLLSRI